VTDDAADAGLALLLGDGVADAMSVAESALATVQSAAVRAFAGLARIQAAGAAAAAVPPVPPVPQAAPDMVDGPEEQNRPAPRSAAPQVVRPAAPEQVAFAPVPIASADTQASTSVPPSLPAVSFAVFAPSPMPMAMPMAAAAMRRPASQDAAPAAVGDSERIVPPDAAAPAAPMATGVASKPSSPSYAPPAAQATQGGPTGGDVFLDGARVGTWLADHLAREAGRPQMGSTGFDPRLTPAWPGTLQGG